MAKFELPEGLSPEALALIIKSFKELNVAAGETAQHLSQMNEDAIALANNVAKTNAKLGEQREVIEGAAAEAERKGKLHNNQYAWHENHAKQLENEANLHRDIHGNLNEQGKALMKQAAEYRHINDSAQNAAETSLEFAQNITGVSDAWRGTVIGSFLEGNFEANLERTMTALKGNFSAANMLGSSLMKVQEATAAMVVSADAEFASLNKLTGTTGEYNDMVMDTMQNNAEYNVSVQDAAESVGALFTEMSNFSNMSKEAQAQAVETTAQLKGLGIDAQTTAANFEIMTGALGMSSQAAGEAQKDFAAMAADLGVSAAKISKDFERNADVFVAYGDQATEVFKEVAAAAKATGIEMDALLGITTQFDTFEGAAKAAGTLNAVLGGGVLNSMDLLNASEEERIRMLIQSIELSGKSWQSMSKFERQAVANAAGIKDMTQASKLFGQSLSEYDAAQEKVQDNAAAQEKLAERAAAAANMKEKLTRIFEQFAVAVQPIISAIHTMLDGFLALNDMMGGFLVPTLIGLLAVWKLYSVQQTAVLAKSAALRTAQYQEAMIKMANATATGTLATAQGVQTATATAATPASHGLAGGIRAIGMAATKFLPALAALGAAMLGLGLAIAAPLILIAVLIWSLKELVLAFMEMPDAIMPALAGMMAFIGLVSIGLPIIALSIVAFFNILQLAIPAVTALAMHLPTMIYTLMGLGIALWLLGKGIKQFRDDDMPGAMVVAVVSLIAFGIGLAIAEKFIKDSSMKVGIAIGILGIGLLLLGKGVKEFNDVTWPAIGFMIVSLIVMGVLLKVAAKFMEMSAWKVGLATAVLGFGLLLLGKGVKEFNEVTWPAIGKMIVSLVVMGILLKLAGKAFLPGALAVGFAAAVLGIGLMLLGKGIKAFEDIAGGLLFALPPALAWFGVALIPAGWGLLIGSAALLVGAIMFYPASHILLAGLKPWMNIDLEKVREIGPALWTLGKWLFPAGLALMFAGIPFFIGAVLIGAGMGVLGWGLENFLNAKIDLNILGDLGWILAELAVGLLFAGIYMAYAGIPFLFGAILLSLGLVLINKPLAEFANTMAVMAPIAGAMPAIAMGLMALGWALPTFAWGILKLGFAASMPFFKTGLKTLNKGLRAFAGAMSGLPTEKAVALGQIFQGLAAFTDLDGIGDIMRDIANGIYWIARALQHMPEGEQAVAFSVAADGLAGLAEASVGLTAESVENVQGLADAAFDYALASRLMRSSQDDALVRALQELAGLARSSQSNQKSGQDIVLEIDGNEFARAVDAAIDSKHGLKF